MRLFIAVEIPDEIKAELSKAAGELEGKGITKAKQEAYHITLQFLGEQEEKLLEKIKEAMSSVKQGRFTVRISGLSFFRPVTRVIFAEVKEGSEELESVYSQIDRNLARADLAYERERDYRPHITIARVKRFADKNLILPIVKKYSEREFGTFTAESMVLKESRTTPTGHEHVVLHKVKF